MTRARSADEMLRDWGITVVNPAELLDEIEAVGEAIARIEAANAKWRGGYGAPEPPDLKAHHQIRRARTAAAVGRWA